MNSEKDLQILCQDYLDILKIKWLHIENNKHNQKYRKNKNDKYKGFLDLEVYLFPSIFFELKYEKNDLTKEQIDWKDYLIKQGYQVYKIKEFEEFKRIIDNIFMNKYFKVV